MAYSTRTDPRRKKPRRLSKSLRQNEKAKASAQMHCENGVLPPIPKNISIRFVKIEPDPDEGWFQLKTALNGLRRATELTKFENRMAKNRGMTKGSIKARRGTTDHDPLHTARKALLILDSGARVFGDGQFIEGKPGEPGKFVSAGTFMGEEEKRTERGATFFVSKAIPDMGPFAIGDSFILQGKGRHPGTDIRRFDQMPSWQRESGPLVPESGWKASYPTRDLGWERHTGHWTGDGVRPRFVPDSRDLTTRTLFKKG